MYKKKHDEILDIVCIQYKLMLLLIQLLLLIIILI